MAAKTLPLDYDIVIYSGTSYRREFRWLPDGTTPMDFTGWGAQMRLGLPGTPATVQLEVGNGITLTPAGQIIVEVTPAQSGLLKAGIAAYNLDLTEPGGFVRRFLRGRVSVVVGVSQAVTS